MEERTQPPTPPPGDGAEGAGERPEVAASASPAPRSARSPRRRRVLAVVAVLAVLVAADLARAPEDQLTAAALLAGIDLYQATLSPVLGASGVQCRFTPTCSHYAEGALERHGALGGTARAGWRLLRCGPWTPEGTVDPP